MSRECATTIGSPALTAAACPAIALLTIVDRGLIGIDSPVEIAADGQRDPRIDDPGNEAQMANGESELVPWSIASCAHQRFMSPPATNR